MQGFRRCSTQPPGGLEFKAWRPEGSGRLALNGRSCGCSGRARTLWDEGGTLGFPTWLGLLLPAPAQLWTSGPCRTASFLPPAG